MLKYPDAYIGIYMYTFIAKYSECGIPLLEHGGIVTIPKKEDNEYF